MKFQGRSVKSVFMLKKQQAERYDTPANPPKPPAHLPNFSQTKPKVARPNEAKVHPRLDRNRVERQIARSIASIAVECARKEREHVQLFVSCELCSPTMQDTVRYRQT